MEQFRQSSTFVSCKSCYSFFSCVPCWQSTVPNFGGETRDHQWHKDQMTCVLEADARRVARGRAPFWEFLTRHAFTNQHAKWEDDFIMSDMSMYGEEEEQEPSTTKRRRKKKKSKATTRKKEPRHYAL